MTWHVRLFDANGTVAELTSTQRERIIGNQARLAALRDDLRANMENGFDGGDRLLAAVERALELLEEANQ